MSKKVLTAKTTIGRYRWEEGDRVVYFYVAAKPTYAESAFPIEDPSREGFQAAVQAHTKRRKQVGSGGQSGTARRAEATVDAPTPILDTHDGERPDGKPSVDVPSFEGIFIPPDLEL